MKNPHPPNDSDDVPVASEPEISKIEILRPIDPNDIGGPIIVPEVGVMEVQRERIKNEHEIRLKKLGIGRNIIFFCLGFLVLIYIAESVMLAFDVQLDFQFRVILIEPVKFLLTATAGYLFAERGRDKDD